ncbi:DNA polymerase phi, partial [Lecanoromycetidae sp. Uapishka_2]
MSKKRRREQPLIDTQLIEIYEDLANVDEKVRFKAAHTLLSKIISADAASGEQQNEVLRRLIRGLCSGRKAARLGFSIALTESLAELYGPDAKSLPGLQTIRELIETLKTQTHVQGNVSGQEERDHQFGRLFGTEAIIKSGILFHSVVSTDIWSLTLDIIYDLARKKPWLREESGFILFNAIATLQDRDSYFAQSIIDKLQANGLARTPEGVAIWIAIKSNCPHVEFPHGIWHHEDPFNRKELSKLAGILNETVESDVAQNETQTKVQQKGTWTNKLHFAWEVALAYMLATPVPALQKKPKSSKRIAVADFWLVCVDNTLFAQSSSLELQSLLSQSSISSLNQVFPVSARKILEDANLKIGATSSSPSVAKYFNSIKLLYSLTLLQVYNNDADALNMLEELNNCFEGLNGSKEFDKGSAALAEILLSFASKPSQLFRRLTQQVFTACASEMAEYGLQSMIRVLETKENLSGQAEIFDQDEEMEDASLASDVEEVDTADAGSTSSSAKSSSEDNGADHTSDSADDSDGPDEELTAFDAKLAQALGTRPGNADLNAEDTSSSDEDMDDEEMEALDEHLENVFKERKKATSKKTEKKDAKATVVNFKCRKDHKSFGIY